VSAPRDDLSGIGGSIRGSGVGGHWRGEVASLGSGDAESQADKELGENESFNG